jgi:hypothetical protein
MGFISAKQLNSRNPFKNKPLKQMLDSNFIKYLLYCQFCVPTLKINANRSIFFICANWETSSKLPNSIQQQFSQADYTNINYSLGLTDIIFVMIANKFLTVTDFVVTSGSRNNVHLNDVTFQPSQKVVDFNGYSLKNISPSSSSSSSAADVTTLLNLIKSQREDITFLQSIISGLQSLLRTHTQNIAVLSSTTDDHSSQLEQLYQYFFQASRSSTIS